MVPIFGAMEAPSWAKAYVSSAYPMVETSSLRGAAPRRRRRGAGGGAPGAGQGGGCSSIGGGKARTATTTGCRRSSMTRFQTVVSKLMKMTERGQPWRMPFVAAKNDPRHPTSLKHRRSCRYMAATARRTPASIPISAASHSSWAWGIRSKHLM